MPLEAALSAEPFCYVTTTGRVTGRPHEIEIWFAARGASVYILAGGGHTSDWVKNGKKHPSVPVRIGARTFDGLMRVVESLDEDALARCLLLEKYSPSNDDLAEWGRTALPVAIDLDIAAR